MNGTRVTVESVREVGPDTVALELETPTGFEPLPGQFVLIRETIDGEELTRYYTLSSPAVSETFELTVGVDPDGDLSPWLADLETGETVYIEGPFGEITYAGDRDVVTIAGGPGVGPAVGIAEAALDAGHESTVIYQDDEPAHTDRLEALADRDVTVRLIDEGEHAALEDAIVTALSDGQCYVFGFSEFVETVYDVIEEAGGDPDEALIENFG